MRTLYQAANAVEAHMILHLLKQHGITGHVLGEHLQGAVGELPAAGLVRVTVDEADHDRGRALIQEWEASMPADAPDNTGKSHMRDAPHGRSGGWKMLLLGLSIGIAGTYGFMRTPDKLSHGDAQGDGQRESPASTACVDTFDRQ